MKEQKAVRYDRDKKVVVLTLNQTYEINEIHKIWADMQGKKGIFEKQVKELKIKTKDLKDEPKELTALRKNLKLLQTADAEDKSKGELKYAETMVEGLKKEILMLEPVVNKLPKPTKKKS